MSHSSIDRPATEHAAAGSRTLHPVHRVWSSFVTWLDTDAAARYILIAILLVGAYLRLSHVNWDMETHIHPDERFLTMVAERLRMPSSLGEYLDSTQSPLNPYNVKDGSGNMQFGLYVYGNLPMTIVRVAAEGANRFNQAAKLWLPAEGGAPIDLTAYWGIHYVGRTLSGLFDLAGVLLIFLIGRRLYGRRAGLLAALFLTFAVLPLQQSHFFTTDTFATFFSLLTFYFAIRVAFGGRAGKDGSSNASEGGWLAYLALGISLGAAIACRINLAPEAGVALLAIGIRAWREWRVAAGEPGDGAAERRWLPMLLQATLFRTLLFGIAAILAFRVFMPYAFGGTTVLDFSFAQHWRDNMTEIQRLISGEVDYPPGHQWTGRTPFVFPFVNMVVWGLGIPLGVTGWLAFLVAFYQIARSLTNGAYARLAQRHLLPVAWVGGMFLWQGLQYVQSMRYLLPIYPILCLLAAWLLWWLVEPAPEGRARAAVVAGNWRKRLGAWGARVAARPAWLRRTAYALLAVVVVFTVLWGWGFLAIYRRPLTRVTASRWIYANVPANSHLANEHWDDPLPLGIDGKCGFQPCGPYTGLSSSPDSLIDNYNEDTPEKREMMYRWLDEADYIILSSNRLYGSIPRLPTRYPMTTLYYQALFNGQLGFRQAAKFTSFPTIFGIQFDDTSAEEAFSVYDHPVVYIFQKTPEYSDAKVRQLLGSVDLENTVQMWPKQASKAPTALLMTGQQAAQQEAGGTWTGIFNENSLANKIPVVVWLVLLELLGLAAFPVLFVVMRGLSDRGYAFAKTFGVLALAWLSWIGPSLKVVPYTRPVIAATLLLLILAGGVLAWRNRPALARLWRERRSLLLIEEGIFLALFAVFLLIRWGNPDLWHPARGGEKPMDLAYLNAVIRSTTFPPYDPWFAGGFINYYYFGFVIIGSLIKLTGIVPWVAYNLAVPTLFALTGLGAFSVAYNLAEGDTETRGRGDTERLAGGDGETRRRGDAATLAGGDAVTRGRGDAVTLAGGDAVEQPHGDVSTGAGGADGEAPRVPASPRPRVSSLLAGFAAMLFVAIAGNLGEVKLLLDRLSQASPLTITSTIPGFAALMRTLVGAVAWLAQTPLAANAFDVPNDWWFWNASRVIPDTINEFPFFTFVYADLHAHMIAFPLALLGLGAAVALVRGIGVPASQTPALLAPGSETPACTRLTLHVPRLASDPNPWRIALPDLWLLLLLGGVIGALRATNTWDFPTYTLVALAAIAVVEAARRAGWRPGLAAETSARAAAGQLPQQATPVTDAPAPMVAIAPVAAVAADGAPAQLAEEAAPATAPDVPTPETTLGNGTNGSAGYKTADAPEAVPDLSAPPSGPAIVEPVPFEVPGSGLSPIQETVAFLFRALVAIIWRTLVVVLVSTVAFYPYIKNYATAYTGLQRWQDATTTLPDYLIVHGFFLAVIGIYLIGEIVQQVREDRLSDFFYDAFPFILGVAVLLIGAGLVLKARIFLIAVPYLMVALVLATGRAIPPARRLALLLIALGVAITMGVEVVRLQDDIGRMNTVFKFYLQAWILMGIGAAVGLASSFTRAPTWSLGWRRLAQVVTVVLLACVLLYPPLAARAKIADRFSAEDQPKGLDGMAYMNNAEYFDQNQNLNIPADKAAIEWMLHNVKGSPVILEGQTPNYRWGSRFSINTGLPAVMGWDWHEKQQRSIVPGTMIDRRQSQVHELYTNPDLARTKELLEYFKVKYIVVGALERAFYGAIAQEKFDSLVQQGYLHVAYEQDGVKIYETGSG